MVDCGVEGSMWNHVIGVSTFLWLVCILWNLWEVIVWTFVPGLIAFHDAAKGSPSYCAAWRTVLVARITAVLSGFLLVFTILGLVIWILSMLMNSDFVAVKVQKIAHSFDHKTTHLPVAQLLMRSMLTPTHSVEEVRLQTARQKQMLIEEDIRRANREMELLQTKLQYASEKVEKLENKKKHANHPVDGDIEKFEEHLRQTMDPEAWRKSGTDMMK